MKAGWDVKKLGEVCNIVNGSTPLRSKKEFWDNGNIEWFTIDDIREQGRKIARTKQMVTEAALKETSLRILPPNSVLLCCTASIGEHAITEIPLATNQQFNGLVVKNKLTLEPLFLFHFCSTLKDVLSNLSGKTTIDFIPISRLREIAIPLPPIVEQQRIVAILDQAFEGIAKARTNAEQNLQNARALFESHLQSVFTQRGEGWINSTLEDIAIEFGRGKSKHRPRNDPKLYSDGKYPFIQTGDIRNCNHIITSHSQTYNDVGLAQSKLWPKGTLCITIAANIAETGILGFDSCFPDSVIGVTVDEKKTSIKFLEYLLQTFKTYLKSKGQGSAQDNINLGTFENQLFPFPPIEEQQSFVSKLDSLREETQRLETLYQRKIELLDELKKSLLQQAFAGEL